MLLCFPSGVCYVHNTRRKFILIPPYAYVHKATSHLAPLPKPELSTTHVCISIYTYLTFLPSLPELTDLGITLTNLPKSMIEDVAKRCPKLINLSGWN